MSLTAAASRGQTTTAPTESWAYIDNGKIRVGALKSSGGAIAFVGDAKAGRNLVNHFDRGRLIQQSYYGDPDGSFWNKTPWRWNPVQGGAWRGEASRLEEFRVDGLNQLYARTVPLHWATGAELPQVTLEQWASLESNIAHVRYRMAYSGAHAHREADQEIPAFFVEPDLDELVLYAGVKPWTDDALSTSKPGWPNESRAMTEHWAAYVGRDGIGIGAYVPKASKLTCYRFGNGGKGACSYFAPITRFTITPGFVFEYDLYLTIGTASEIRRRFTAIHTAEIPAASQPATRPTQRSDSH